MEDFVVVFTTFPNEPEAKACMDALLKSRLIACANIVPRVHSCFLWKKTISSEEEVMVVMKTQKKRVQKLTETIQEQHAYEVAEVIALPIIAGSAEYLQWIKEETT